jgi:YHS domain-containing protein
MKQNFARASWIGLVLFCLILTVGCGGYESGDTAAEPSEETTVATEAVEEEAAPELAIEIPAPMAEMVGAVLAKADAYDGTTDQIIANCPGCALAMEGNPDHALHIAGHELHFCSEDCKAQFAENAMENLIALNDVATEE